MFEKFVDQIEASEGGISVQIIKDILDCHADWKSRMLASYERYKASTLGVPINSRTLPTENKINNKLANDIYSEIIDTKVGYMFGIPVTINLDKTAPQHDQRTKDIQRFRRVNNLDDMNAETCKFSAMCGYDVNMAYIDKEGQERVMRVDPWNAVILSTTEITEPAYAVRYFETWDKKLRVEFYDATTRTVYESPNTSAGQLQQVGEPEAHMFDYCPLVGIPNNAEMQGDGDKVLTLIDAYDRSMSDVNSEIEQFRLAYMLFFGVEPTVEMMDKLVQTGAIHIPYGGTEENMRVEFLTKTIEIAAVDSHLDRLEANITRFAKHVNFSDAFGGGQVTGPAMKYKIFMLETKAKYFERKHEAAMAYLFKVIASAWEKKSAALDYTQLDFKYTRNVPVNVLDEANAGKALLGFTSRRTALSTLSFINDVDEEMAEIEQENEDSVNLDAIPPGDPQGKTQTA
jgi:SPP1 family phage portal protein